MRNTSTAAAISFSNDTYIVHVSGPLSPLHIASDVDGDGKVDLVVRDANSKAVTVYRNTSSEGKISFAARVDVPYGRLPSSLAIGDLNNDGKPDLTTVISGFKDSVLIFRNTTTGNNFSFAPRVLAGIIPFYSSWGEFDLTDLDGDGKRGNPCYQL
jgi:hypothetical protein